VEPNPPLYFSEQSRRALAPRDIAWNGRRLASGAGDPLHYPGRGFRPLR
jgi:hypothetical protein